MEIPDSLLTQTEEIFLMLIKEGLCDSIGHTLNAKEEEDFSSKMKIDCCLDQLEKANYDRPKQIEEIKRLEKENKDAITELKKLTTEAEQLDNALREITLELAVKFNERMNPNCPPHDKKE